MTLVRVPRRSLYNRLVLRVLLVEDDPDVRLAVAPALSSAGHEVVPVADGAAALERLSAEVFDVVVSDIRLPRVDGLTVFRAARALPTRTDVVLMTSFATVADAVSALKEGAHDYLTKPFDLEELVLRVGDDREAKGSRGRARDRHAPGSPAGPTSRSSGRPPRWPECSIASRPSRPATRRCSSWARRARARSSPRGACTPGVTRASRPFVAVNCAAFPETLLEAELFGYERGAFTGAVRRREGRFKAADRGTLFLDEIAEMPLPAQAKLLRVVQDGVIEPLGTNEGVRVDVRLVSATNRDLKKAIAEGRFREDLYYRLHGVGLNLPPLRDRPGDLPLLVAHFLSRFSTRGAAPPEISLPAWQALSTYPFPGNVRELAHAIQHAAVLSRGGTILVSCTCPMTSSRSRRRRVRATAR